MLAVIWFVSVDWSWCLRRFFPRAQAPELTTRQQYHFCRRKYISSATWRMTWESNCHFSSIRTWDPILMTSIFFIVLFSNGIIWMSPIFVGCQCSASHRSASMDFLGRYTYFCSKTKTSTVWKTSRSIVINNGRIYLILEFLCCFLIVRYDTFWVMRRVFFYVIYCFFQGWDDFDDAAEWEPLGEKIFFGNRCRKSCSDCFSFFCKHFDFHTFFFQAFEDNMDEQSGCILV